MRTLHTLEHFTEFQGVFSSFSLKCLALTCMVIDHWGLLFISPGENDLWRIIGRLAFPIFCFLLIEGYYHTQNLCKYLQRLALFAFLSEVIYDWIFYANLFYPQQQNIFFTLLIGLCAVALIDRSLVYAGKTLQLLHLNTPGFNWMNRLLSLGIKVLALVLAVFFLQVFKADYQLLGLAMIFAFYFLRKKNLLLTLTLFLINFLGEGGLQIYAVLAMLPIGLYNGRRGPKVTYGFYLFYPLHLLFFALVQQLV